MTSVLLFFFFFFQDILCYSLCPFLVHVCVCKSGDGTGVWAPACGGQRLTLNVFLDCTLLLSTEAGCLAEPRTHQLGSWPSHLSLDPCSCLLSAGIAGMLSCLHGFYVYADKCFTHWGSPQTHCCGILIDIFYFPHSFYISLLRCFWKEGLFLIPA